MSDDHPPQFDPEELGDSARDAARSARGRRRRRPRGRIRPQSRPGSRRPAGVVAGGVRRAVTLGSYEENAGIPALLADTKLFTSQDGNQRQDQHLRPRPVPGAHQQLPAGPPGTTSSRGSPATGCSSSRRRVSRRRSTTSGRPLTPQMPPAFKAASTGSDGHQYFVPNKNYPWAVHFRKSLWKENGYKAPKTWAQFIALAKKMKADGLTPIAFTDKDGWPPMGTFDILNMRINGYEFHVALMAGKQSWDSPQVKAVFKKWTELLPLLLRGRARPHVAGRRGAAREQAGRHVLPRLVPHRRHEARERRRTSTSSRSR